MFEFEQFVTTMMKYIHYDHSLKLVIIVSSFCFNFFDSSSFCWHFCLSAAILLASWLNSMRVGVPLAVRQLERSLAVYPSALRTELSSSEMKLQGRFAISFQISAFLSRMTLRSKALFSL